MSQLVIFMSCLLAMACQVQSATKTSACSSERLQLRYEVVASSNELRKEMPGFYSKKIKCRGYIEKESPFPITMLKGHLKHFVGSKFLQQNFKLFMPFVDAFMAILNGSIATPSKAPQLQLWNVKTAVTKVAVCAITKIPSNQQPKSLALKYNAALHKMDVKKCLIKAGEKATPRRVQIVQLNEIFEELYNAVNGMRKVIWLITYLKLK